MAGKAASIGLGQAMRSPRISGAASARCRRPPTTSRRREQRGGRGRTGAPSSPMPRMASQGGGHATTARMRVLILGGTTEASAIARGAGGDARFSPVLSLAGRTRAPVPPPIPWRRRRVRRRGRAGGVSAAGARGGAGGRHASLRRPHEGQRGRRRAGRRAALACCGPPGRRWPATAGPTSRTWPAPPPRSARRRARVFLTVGQGELAPFRAAGTATCCAASTPPPPAAAGRRC